MSDQPVGPVSPVRDPAPPDYRSYALARAQDESKRLAALLAETAIERNDLLREREELLAGEHALSDAYVRLRSILGAFDTPPAPTPEQIWAHTEAKAQALVDAVRSWTVTTTRR